MAHAREILLARLALVLYVINALGLRKFAQEATTLRLLDTDFTQLQIMLTRYLVKGRYKVYK